MSRDARQVKTGTHQRETLNYRSVCQSVHRMSAEHVISPQEETETIANLPADLEDARYILKHLSTHLAIGGFRYLTMIPLPIGSTFRPLWVLTWRIIETVRGNRARARVHSLAVFLFAIVPFLGYTSYLIALRKSNERFAFIVANHLCYVRRDISAAQFYEGRSALGRWLMRVVVPPAAVAMGRETQG